MYYEATLSRLFIKIITSEVQRHYHNNIDPKHHHNLPQLQQKVPCLNQTNVLPPVFFTPAVSLMSHKYLLETETNPTSGQETSMTKYST